jgi:hypothetical protein
MADGASRRAPAWDRSLAPYGVGPASGTRRASLSDVSVESDNVFRDGAYLQMADVSGSPSAGYEATLRVSVPT